MNKLCQCGCGEEVKNNKSTYLQGHHTKTKAHKDKVKQSNLVKYGVESTNQLDSMKEKRKDSMIKNHGVEHSLQSEKIRAKAIKTTLSNHGVEYSMQSEHVRSKFKNTSLKKYGHEHPFQNKDIQKKMNDTMIKRYGAPFTLQSDNLKQKSRDTCMKNHGVYVPYKSKGVRNKGQSTCLERYGVENVFTLDEIKQKSKCTCIKKYGVDNWSKTDEGRRNSREVALRHIEIQLGNDEPVMPRVGDNERPFLNELQKYTDFEIIRQDHSFRNTIVRFPDGHIPELKLIILFDERSHFEDKECTIRDEKTCRETKDYESLDGYIVFRVSELDWINDKHNIINRFILLCEYVNSSI